MILEIDTTHIVKKRSAEEIGSGEGVADDMKRHKKENIPLVPEPGEKTTTTTNKTTKFGPRDKGPFIIHVMKEDSSPLNEFIIGNAFQKHGLLTNKQVISIRNINPNVVKIHCENWVTANKFLEEKNQNILKITCKIPTNHLYSEGVVNNIPLDMSIEDLSTSIESEGKIHNIERIQRWNHETKTLVPTTTVKITFREFTLPDKVHICRVPTRVFYYVPNPIFCKLCKRYGHTKKYCKQPNTCPKCLLEHNAAECPQPEKNCRYCPEATHKTGDRTCPETIIQREIKKLMTIHRITYTTAKNRLVPTNMNKPIPNVTNPIEFPPLKNKTESAQNRLQAWQDPNSQLNQLEQTTQMKNNYKDLIKQIVDLMKTENHQHPIIAQIEKTCQIIENISSTAPQNTPPNN